MKSLIRMDECHFCTLTNVGAEGAFDAAIELNDCSGNVFKNVYLNVQCRERNENISKNQKCPCGSRIRYKNCHGAKKMGDGIRVKGSRNEFNRTTVVAEGEGIVVDGDDNRFTDTDVFSSKLNVVEIVDKLSLPKNTPIPLILEAIKEIQVSGGTGVSTRGRLSAWLYDNGFNMAFWAQTLQSLAVIAFDALSKS